MGSFRVADCDVLRGLYDQMGFRSTVGWPLPSSLILNGESGELVKSPGRFGEKRMKSSLVSELKSAMAMKTHSEAERRRRERINGHLQKLRGLIPTATKMDKAGLLAEVINQVKELASKVDDITAGYNFPSDINNMQVDTTENHTNKGSYIVEVSICCDYRPELLGEIQKAVDSVYLKTLKADFLIFDDRIRLNFLMKTEGNISMTHKRSLLSSLQRALASVVDQASTETDHLPRSLPFENS